MQSALATSVLRLVYPGRCLTCGARTETDFSLCGPCWQDTPFTVGLVCDLCGVPLPGEDRGEDAHCDDCMRIARPWAHGRAVMRYADKGRRLVLGLKHGDRTDIARAAGLWLAIAARPLLKENMLIVPVPLHWSRLLRRRFNQSALLAQHLAHETKRDFCPDALIRTKRTRALGGKSRDDRFAELMGTIVPHRTRGGRMAGRPVLIVDDVMTSGATMSAATEAALAAGATEVCTLHLARAAKDT